jgi:hypothetical protein
MKAGPLGVVVQLEPVGGSRVDEVYVAAAVSELPALHDAES